jgi:hypothetical protein
MKGDRAARPHIRLEVEIHSASSTSSPPLSNWSHQ